MNKEEIEQMLDGEKLKELQSILEDNIPPMEMLNLELPAIYWYHMLQLAVVGGAKMIETTEEEGKDSTQQVMMLATIYANIYTTLTKAAGK
jgi:hypothetical protein